MKTRVSGKRFLLVQVVVVSAIGAAVAWANIRQGEESPSDWVGIPQFTPVPVDHVEPYRVQPLYNRPDWLSDEDLAAVLKQVQPPFGRYEMKPNHVEHALRTWGVDAVFADPNIVSGQEMVEFLTDNGKYIASWGDSIRPLLEERPTGVAIRWGREVCGSVHHDHWLACLTEAGASLDTPVYGVSRQNHTLQNVLQEALRDFRLDERETEWTAMAFGLWIPPVKEWTGSDGRQYSFDLLADRLMRGRRDLGVCSGTHRVYSLALLYRLDEKFDILTEPAQTEVYHYLEGVRDAIVASQFEDGHWPSNWHEGAAALANPAEDEIAAQVIATGHHLEWLSIAPPELHPGNEQIQKAMDWCVRVTTEQTHDDIKLRYTFFSHIGAALANWRQVRPAEFWHQWELDHPQEYVLRTEADEAPAAPDAGH